MKNKNLIFPVFAARFVYIFTFMFGLELEALSKTASDDQKTNLQDTSGIKPKGSESYWVSVATSYHSKALEELPSPYNLADAQSGAGQRWSWQYKFNLNLFTVDVWNLGFGFANLDHFTASIAPKFPIGKSKKSSFWKPMISLKDRINLPNQSPIDPFPNTQYLGLGLGMQHEWAPQLTTGMSFQYWQKIAEKVYEIDGEKYRFQSKPYFHIGGDLTWTKEQYFLKFQAIYQSVLQNVVQSNLINPEFLIKPLIFANIEAGWHLNKSLNFSTFINKPSIEASAQETFYIVGFRYLPEVHTSAGITASYVFY